MISGSGVVLIMELEPGSVPLDFSQHLSLHQSQQVFNFRPFAFDQPLIKDQSCNVSLTALERDKK